MRYRKLGRAGFEVSEIAHGLWGMGGWSGSEDSESLAALQLAVELGFWSYRQGGARRRQSRREDDQGHEISRQRLALAVLQSRESRQHLGTRGQTQTNSAARNVTAADGAALRAFSSCGEHDDCRHEEIGACPRKRRFE